MLADKCVLNSSSDANCTLVAVRALRSKWASLQNPEGLVPKADVIEAFTGMLRGWNVPTHRADLLGMSRTQDIDAFHDAGDKLESCLQCMLDVLHVPVCLLMQCERFKRICAVLQNDAPSAAVHGLAADSTHAMAEVAAQKGVMTQGTIEDSLHGTAEGTTRAVDDLSAGGRSMKHVTFQDAKHGTAENTSHAVDMFLCDVEQERREMSENDKDAVLNAVQNAVTDRIYAPVSLECYMLLLVEMHLLAYELEDICIDSKWSASQRALTNWHLWPPEIQDMFRVYDNDYSEWLALLGGLLKHELWQWKNFLPVMRSHMQRSWTIFCRKYNTHGSADDIHRICKAAMNRIVQTSCPFAIYPKWNCRNGQWAGEIKWGATKRWNVSKYDDNRVEFQLTVWQRRHLFSNRAMQAIEGVRPVMMKRSLD